MNLAYAKYKMVLANKIKYQKFTWCYVRETHHGSMIYCVVFADNDGNEMFSYEEFTFEEAELFSDEFNLS